MKMKNRITQGLLVASLMTASAGAWAAGAGAAKTAVDALNCTDDSCPYPTDLYKSDPVYAHDIESNLSAAGMANLIGPSGKLAGPEDPLSPVQIGGKTWLKSMVCEAGNCGYHYFNFLYQPDSHRLLGYYFDGKGVWVGKPDNEEASILTDGEIKPAPVKQVLRRLPLHPLPRLHHRMRRQPTPSGRSAIKARRSGRPVADRTAPVRLWEIQNGTLRC